ncbi:MAG TPA: exosortase/archaeosortase family protein [Candidatus Aminicenantes bacterium]|nr:exosortase/archaeosortase family protein [Candidatus Aminicenantes bacterium]
MISRASWIHIFCISIIFILFIAAYYDVLSWMYGRYVSSDSYYSHGFIIPFISGFLIWRKREELKGRKPESSWWGLLLIIFSILLHLFGTAIYVFSISGFSIFFLVLGLSLFLFGREITRIILFPLIFLVFMFPLPMAVISLISFPMKMLVVKTGAWIAALLGVPVNREGFNIIIPAGNLLVGNPCSGLRSLISLLALGSLYAYLSDLSVVKQWLLVFLTIPIALLSNIIRVPILILISHYWGLAAAARDSFWHDASGFFVFVIAIILLFYTSRLLKWSV